MSRLTHLRSISRRSSQLISWVVQKNSQPSQLPQN